MEQWWKLKGNDTSKSMLDTVKQIKQHQQYRNMENLRHARLYGNVDVLGLNSYNYSRPNLQSLDNRITYNVIQSCIDTLVSKIGTNKPRPTFLTEEGKFDDQEKAKKLDKYVRGTFEAEDCYKKTTKAFLHAAVFGTSFIKTYSENGQVKLEHTLTDEITVDDAESIYGTPRNLYHTKVVSREVLKDAFPKFKNEIDALNTVTETGGMVKGAHADIVEVVEGWHLPTSKDSKDGKHAIVIENVTLTEDTWKRSRFPFSRLCYNQKLFGYFGQGVAERLLGIQLEINKILKNIQVAHHLLSAPAVYVQNGSQVVKSHLNNEIGRIVTYTGSMPQVQVFQTIHPEIYEHLERLYARAFELEGISQLSAQAQKPSGLDSGKALREFYNIESERFKDLERRWEEFHMDIAESVIIEAKEIYDSGENPSVKVAGRNFINNIKWSDVDMSEDRYIMKIFPVSQLPKEPAGKLAAVQELMQAGIIDPETGAELLDYPDLEAAQKKKFSPRAIVRKQVDMIMDKKEYEPPEPFIDLAYGVQYGQQCYNNAKIDGAGEDVLEMLRRYIEQCAELDSKAQEAAMMAQNQMAAPMGQPPELPQADLMQAQ